MPTEPDRVTPGLGVWLFPNAPADQLVAAVVRAEALGLNEIWIADEGIARDPMAILAAAASQTETITLATGITSVPLRHPGAIAAAAATVDELSGGRFRLGLGVGGKKSLGPFGLVVERPVGVLKEAIDTARAVLSVSEADGYTPDRHAFGPRPVPIWVGARGPQLVRLAARRADGLFLSGCSPAQHDEIVTTARTLNADIGVALYQSAASVTANDSMVAWTDVARVLSAEMARHQPTSIGINLVELATGHADPVALVERAASVLNAVVGSNR